MQGAGLTRSVYINHAPIHGGNKVHRPYVGMVKCETGLAGQPSPAWIQAYGIFLSGNLAGVLVTKAASHPIAGPTADTHSFHCREFVSESLMLVHG